MEIKFIRADKLPEKTNLNSSDVLLVKRENGKIEIGFYNYDNIGENSGYYKSPNLVEKINDVTEYLIAPANAVFKCENCKDFLRRDQMVGSEYIPQIGGQSFPCCSNCKKCLSFEFQNIDEEE